METCLPVIRDCYCNTHKIFYEKGEVFEIGQYSHIKYDNSSGDRTSLFALASQHPLHH